jgi:hypothetical protein
LLILCKIKSKECEKGTMIERIVRDHAGKLALGIMASGVILYNVMTESQFRDGSLPYGSQQQDNEYSGKAAPAPVLTIEQARLRAMIENAQQSTWQENLDNALVAQEKFMLGNERGEREPEFMKKIEARSQELMQQAKQKRQLDLEKEKKRMVTTRMW